MQTPLPFIDRAVEVTVDSDSQEPVAKITAKSFVKIACLIAPDLPVATGGMLAVTLNGQTVATYPGRIRKFPSRKI